MVSLTACNRAEHAYNKIKKQSTSPTPSDIPALRLKTEKHDIEVITLLTDIYLPWALTALPDGSLLITEKSGALYRVDPKTQRRISISGLPDSKLWGQGGLMDVIPHPEFASNQWLYFSYTAQVSRKLAATEVARGKLVGDSIEDLEVLFTATPGVNSGAHFGSALVFDDQGYLYITSGERGSRPLVQDLGTHIGKIIRLNDDGSVPSTNPYVDTDGALPEIYSIGHRNPQGIAIEPLSRQIWSVEHGPRGGDEINIIEAGKNYGWPVISHGVEYASGRPIGEGRFKAGMEQPLYYYVPSIATSGMAFYQGEAFPAWQGNLLIGALAMHHLNSLEIKDGRIHYEERILTDLKRRIRHVAAGTDGLLYLLTDRGELLQLEPLAEKH